MVNEKLQIAHKSRQRLGEGSVEDATTYGSGVMLQASHVKVKRGMSKHGVEECSSHES